jgi:hypothetical protein
MGVQNRLHTKPGARPVFFVDPNQRSSDENASELLGGALKSAPLSRLPNHTPTQAQAARPESHARTLEYAGPIVGVVGAFAAITYVFGLVAAFLVVSMIAGLVIAGGIWVLNNTPSL